MTRSEFIQQYVIETASIPTQNHLDAIQDAQDSADFLEKRFGYDFFQPTQLHSNVDAAIHWG